MQTIPFVATTTTTTTTTTTNNNNNNNSNDDNDNNTNNDNIDDDNYNDHTRSFELHGSDPRVALPGSRSVFDHLCPSQLLHFLIV